MHPMLAHTTVSAPVNDTPTMSFNGPVTPETLAEAILAKAHYMSVDEVSEWLYKQRAVAAFTLTKDTMAKLDIDLVAIHGELADGRSPNAQAVKLAKKIFALGLV